MAVMLILVFLIVLHPRHYIIAVSSLSSPATETISIIYSISMLFLGKPPALGRAVVCKNQNKSFKAYLAISRDFPIDFARLLDVLEVVAPFKHFNKLREFVQLKLPPGFPVQIEIPIFPTIVAKVTFQVGIGKSFWQL